MFPAASSRPTQYGKVRRALRCCHPPRKPPGVKVTSVRESGRRAAIAVAVGSTGPGMGSVNGTPSPSALEGTRGETAYVVPLQDEEDRHARQRGGDHPRLQRAEVDRAEAAGLEVEQRERQRELLTVGEEDQRRDELVPRRQ